VKLAGSAKGRAVVAKGYLVWVLVSVRSAKGRITVNGRVLASKNRGFENSK
jgi:hypothetical protein